MTKEVLVMSTSFCYTERKGGAPWHIWNTNESFREQVLPSCLFMALSALRTTSVH